MAAVLELHRALGIERPAVFATVGGGGKTRLLFALAEEAAQSDGDHGLTTLTTTTKMTVPPVRGAASVGARDQRGGAGRRA